MKLVPRQKKYTILMIGILLTATSPLFAQDVCCTNLSSISVLGRGLPVERELQPRAVHSYLVDLQKGQVLAAEINELGVDVIVRTFSPERDMISEIDSSENDWGKESIEIKARYQGIYRIEVTSLKKTGAQGKYNIRIETITTPGRSGPATIPYR